MVARLRAAGGDPDRQDQPRPVRHRPRRRAHAVSGAAKRPRPGHRAGWVVVGIGRRGGAGHRDLRPRHRHRGVRAGARRAQQHRRAEADSLGAISTTGVVPACRTLDTVSIFALTVDDAWEVFRTAAGFDAADPYARRGGRGPPRRRCRRTRRSAFPTAARAGSSATRRRNGAFDAACEALEALGAHLVEIDFAPFYAVAEHALRRRLGRRAARGAGARSSTSDPDAVNPVVRKIVSAATGLTATDAFRGFYRLEELRAETAPLIDAVDMLCVPSIPTFYSLDDLAARPDRPERTARHLHQLRQPPRPLRPGGPAPAPARRPAGQRHPPRPRRPRRAPRQPRPPARTAAPARPRRHRLVAAAARRTRAAAAGADEMEIVVCGAHMSGLPLNHELVRLGGRFLREARTTPVYRLYSLAGGPPRRPGMVRASDGKGAAIHVEVWALPRAAFGDFLAGVPAPLVHRHRHPRRRHRPQGLPLRAGRHARRHRRERDRRLAAGDRGARGVTARSGPEAHMRRGDAPTLRPAHPDLASAPRACPTRGGGTRPSPPRHRRPAAGHPPAATRAKDPPGRGRGGTPRSPRMP